MKQTQILMIQPHQSGWYKNGIPGKVATTGDANHIDRNAQIDQNKMFGQHQKLVSLLQGFPFVDLKLETYPDERFKCIEGQTEALDKNTDSPKKYIKDNAVFSRDGFISNQEDTILISNFSNPNREQFEAKIIKELLGSLSLDRNIVVTSKNKKLKFEGGDFRYISKDKILFAGLDKTGKYSRNNEEGVSFVQKSFGVPHNNMLIIDSTSFHLDCAFSVVTDDGGNLIGGVICSEIVKNIDEVKRFFMDKGLFLFNVSNDYAIAGSLSSNNGSINTLNIKNHLIGKGLFTDEIEKKLVDYGIERHIVDTSEFWKLSGSVHCLTNQL